MGEDNMVEHVMVECVKYARDRNEMMQVVLKELGNSRVEKIRKEWMVVLLGLCGEMSERMIEAVKGFLEKMCARCRDQDHLVRVYRGVSSQIEKNECRSKSGE
ncbi:hypothetical protein E2C01_034493 [Portunus trituberculatus]|uniref:Uncharacterized protein n=1 Tax=Portunus trituberculatus TaxID=210409 RepID=A0A5B7F6U4_PORTR|nr:hypothetical protein [Portunus trituberculatus]